MSHSRKLKSPPELRETLPVRRAGFQFVVRLPFPMLALHGRRMLSVQDLASNSRFEKPAKWRRFGSEIWSLAERSENDAEAPASGCFALGPEAALRFGFLRTRIRLRRAQGSKVRKKLNGREIAPRPNFLPRLQAEQFSDNERARPPRGPKCVAQCRSAAETPDLTKKAHLAAGS